MPSHKAISVNNEVIVCQFSILKSTLMKFTTKNLTCKLVLIILVNTPLVWVSEMNTLVNTHLLLLLLHTSKFCLRETNRVDKIFNQMDN